MPFYYNTEQNFIQTFPTPSGPEWVEMPGEQPTPNHVAKLIDGVPTWVAVEPPKVYKQFTGMEKFDLFSEDEQRAIAAASMTDIDVKLFYDKFMTALYITYDNPLMEKGLRQLADGGFLTEDRYAEIVTKMTTTD